MSMTLSGDSVITAPLTMGFGSANNTTNVAVGLQALNVNTTGAYNTSIGWQSLYVNTTG